MIPNDGIYKVLECVSERAPSGAGRRLPEYLEAMASRGRKAETLKCVATAVRRCSDALARMGVTEPEDVEPEDVAAMSALIGGAESSRKQWTMCMGGYLLWATGRDVVRQARLLWNSTDGEGKVWIDAEGYRRMMEASGPRDRLVLALGATMGLRRTEIAALSLSDVGGSSIAVRGKGHGSGKAVDKPMSRAVRLALDDYLAVRPEGSDALLVSSRGGRLSGSGVYELIRRAGERAGVEVTPHSLRRLYAMTMADAGVDLETMARMMRHESTATTMRCYLKADPRRMERAQEEVDALLARRYRQG